MKKLIFLTLSAILLSGCESLDILGIIHSQSVSVNTRFAESMTYNASHPAQEFEVNADEYSFYTLTDIHSTAECPSLQKFVSTCLADGEAQKFVICLGDVENGKDYFKNVMEILKPLGDASWTFFCTPGNHDLYFGEWERYKEYWPASSYVFTVKTKTAGRDLYVCMDSAEGTVGTDQRRWLEETLSAAKGVYRHITVFTHTNMFKKNNSQSTSGNLNLEETYDLMSLFGKYGVHYVLCGHDHYCEYVNFRNVEYYTLNALCNDKPSFYRATMGEGLKLTEMVAE